MTMLEKVDEAVLKTVDETVLVSVNDASLENDNVRTDYAHPVSCKAVVSMKAEPTRKAC